MITAEQFCDFMLTRLPDINGYHGFIPDDPVECAVVFTYGGDPDLYLIGFDEQFMQVRVRGETNATAEALANRVYKALHAVTHIVFGGHSVKYIIAQDLPNPLGMSSSMVGDGGSAQYPEYTVNFRLKAHEIEEVSD